MQNEIEPKDDSNAVKYVVDFAEYNESDKAMIIPGAFAYVSGNKVVITKD